MANEHRREAGGGESRQCSDGEPTKREKMKKIDQPQVRGVRQNSRQKLIKIILRSSPLLNAESQSCLAV